MVIHRRGVLQMLEQLLVALDILAREVLVTDENRGNFRTGKDLAHALVCCDSDLLVCGGGEDVRVDDGRVARVGGADRDVATGYWRHERCGDRGVLVTVGGLRGTEIA